MYKKQCYIYGNSGNNAVIDCVNVSSEISIDKERGNLTKFIFIDLSSSDEIEVIDALEKVNKVKDISLIRVDKFDMFNSNTYRNVELVQVKSFNRGSYTSIIIQFALNKEVEK